MDFSRFMSKLALLFLAQESQRGILLNKIFMNKLCQTKNTSAGEN